LQLKSTAAGVQISKKTLWIIRQNIAVSIFIKVVFIMLALVGWATLWMAVAADMAASLDGLCTQGSVSGALQGSSSLNSLRA
jgi:cation transport ATPase